MTPKKETISKGDWVGGVSDGLSRPCQICDKHPDFDWKIEDEVWQGVVPKEKRNDVLCLSCFDHMATEKGIDISSYLLEVQFCGKGKTIILKPEKVFYYDS